MYNRHRVKGQEVRKGRKGIFCGYTPDSNAYKVWVLSISDYVTTGDVTWDEKQLKPLIEQAIILEQGENSHQSNNNEPISSSQGQMESGRQATEPSATAESIGESPVRDTVHCAESDAPVNDEPIDWEEWMERAMSRIGHFLASGTRGN